MNLNKAVESLHRLEKEVAIDLGVHGNCILDSNCPKAVELRFMMGKLEVTTEDLEAIAAIPLMPEMDFSRLNDLNIPAILQLSIGDETIEVPFTRVATQDIRYILEERMNKIQNVSQRLRIISHDFMRSLYSRLINSETIKRLEQLEFPERDLIKYRPLITSFRNTYKIYMPIRYAPRYIYTNGVRYELSDGDKAIINTKGVYAMYSFNSNYSQTGSPLTKKFDRETNAVYGFSHYHGDTGGNCWGQVRTLDFDWDGQLSSLYDQTRNLEGALVTINKDSLVNRHPHGWPHADELLQRATVIGTEGVGEIPEIETFDELNLDTDFYDEAELPEARRGWGG